MVNQNQHLRIKITGAIFAAFNLLLISLGLSSCAVEVQNPINQTEQQKEHYKNQPSQKPQQIQQNDEDNDHKKDDDDKDDDDKD
ncbi:hypothetical protein BV378_03000 [Nostoc sp. RF31YmG]|jgi:hypothetical protein|nr:hypothetical protein BV378_03000 [Nostoc sp. RF31YmG]